jgi:hypothetical protein
MSETVSWVSPLLLLPGVGLLLVSTSARFESVHENIHQLLVEKTREAKQCAVHAAGRARLLAIAMCSLYFATAALALSGLCGAVSVWWPQWPESPAIVFLTLGVLSLVVSGVTLTRESTLTLAIIAKHSREIGPDS